MTLAVALKVDGIPIVFADMLISKDGGTEQADLQLPSSGPVTNFPSGRPVLHGLRQKVTVVADNLVVAFADRVGAAMLVIRQLKRMARTQTLTATILEDYYRSNPQLFIELSMVGFISTLNDDGSSRVHALNWNSSEFKHHSLGSFIGAGSGVKLLFDEHSCFPALHYDGPTLDLAIDKVLFYCASLVRAEHAVGYPVVEGASGGSYEVAFFDGKKFKKVSEYTMVAWDMEIRDSVFYCIPFLTLRQGYERSDAVINSARWDNTREGDHRHYVCHTAIVPETSGVAPEMMAPLGVYIGFESLKTYHCGLVHRDDGAWYLFGIRQAGQQGFRSGETKEGRFIYQMTVEFGVELERAARR